MDKLEKKAKLRDSKIDSIYDQLQTGGYSEEERAMLLQMLSKMSGGEEYFIGKKKKPNRSGEICANYNG